MTNDANRDFFDRLGDVAIYGLAREIDKDIGEPYQNGSLVPAYYPSTAYNALPVTGVTVPRDWVLIAIGIGIYMLFK